MENQGIPSGEAGVPHVHKPHPGKQSLCLEKKRLLPVSNEFVSEYGLM